LAQEKKKVKKFKARYHSLAGAKAISSDMFFGNEEG